MNLKEFSTCYQRIMSYWPMTYCLIADKTRYPNDVLSAFMYARIGERITVEDWNTGADNLLATGGPHDPSHIIAAINEGIAARARKKCATTAKKEPCRLCLDTGMVCTKDDQDYEFVFRCPSNCKPISPKIPIWDNQPGYRVSLVTG